jgi:hypothetical protein
MAPGSAVSCDPWVVPGIRDFSAPAANFSTTRIEVPLPSRVAHFVPDIEERPSKRNKVVHDGGSHCLRCRILKKKASCLLPP